MKTIRGIIVALVAGLALAGVALATTASGGTPTITRQSINIQADGTTNIGLVYTNASGAVVHLRTLIVAADRSSVTDQFGTVLASPSPAALNNAISAFTTQLDTMIANAAAANKLNL